jgi:hypothetical protein
LVGLEDLALKNKKGNDKNDIGIADCENFFFVNYTVRGAVSPYSANLVIDIATVETANTY